MIGNGSSGLVIGVVCDLEDPEKLGRIQVTYPHLDDQKSHWARLVSLMAGADRGVFFRPEVKDEVVVAFEQGDPRRPYILGSVWSKADKPPKDDGKAKDNNWRMIHSRSGHVVKFDDTKGKERIEIQGKSKKHTIVIDDAGDKISIICDSGDIEINAGKGNVKIEAAKGDVAIKAQKVLADAPEIAVTGKQKVSVEAPTIEMKAKAQMTLDGGGMMTIKGGLVKIN